MISYGPEELPLQDLPRLLYIRRPIEVEDVNAVVLLVVLDNNAQKILAMYTASLFPTFDMWSIQSQIAAKTG